MVQNINKILEFRIHKTGVILDKKDMKLWLGNIRRIDCA